MATRSRCVFRKVLEARDVVRFPARMKRAIRESHEPTPDDAGKLAERQERALAMVLERARRETCDEPDIRPVTDLKTTFDGLADGIAATAWVITADRADRKLWPMGVKVLAIAQARVWADDASRASHRDTKADATGEAAREYDSDLARFRTERERELTLERAEQARALLGPALADAIQDSPNLKLAAELLKLDRMTMWRKLRATRLAILAAEQVAVSKRKQVNSVVISDAHRTVKPPCTCRPFTIPESWHDPATGIYWSKGTEAYSAQHNLGAMGSAYSPAYARFVAEAMDGKEPDPILTALPSGVSRRFRVFARLENRRRLLRVLAS